MCFLCQLWSLARSYCMHWWTFGRSKVGTTITSMYTPSNVIKIKQLLGATGFYKRYFGIFLVRQCPCVNSSKRTNHSIGQKHVLEPLNGWSHPWRPYQFSLYPIGSWSSMYILMFQILPLEPCFVRHWITPFTNPFTLQIDLWKMH